MNTARQANHHASHSNLTKMYPGVYRPGSAMDDHGDDGPNLPTGPLNTLLGFELETYQIPLDQLLPSKKVPEGVMSTRKYKQIVSSINEVGLIEPLSVIQPDRKKPEYLVLDGHMRVLALKELGMSVGPCLFAKDDETFSYNHHINRLSTNRQYGQSHGVDYRSVMPTNLYGPGDNYHPENSHVIPALIRRFHEAKVNNAPSVTIWGTGTPKREFLYVDDMAAASVHVMNLPQSTYSQHTQPMLSHINVGYGQYLLSLLK